MSGAKALSLCPTNKDIMTKSKAAIREQMMRTQRDLIDGVEFLLNNGLKRIQSAGATKREKDPHGLSRYDSYYMPQKRASTEHTKWCRLTKFE